MAQALIHSREHMKYLVEQMEKLARAEIMVALVQPQHNLVNLLNNRSEDLRVKAIQKAHEEEIHAAIERNENWGMF